MNKIAIRSASTSAKNGLSPTIVSVPHRPLKKIKPGKARPAIYYTFKSMVELSDGSVVYRKSQLPKAETRFIQDQRNNPLWNFGEVVRVKDKNSKIEKFKQKYGMLSEETKEAKDTKDTGEQDSLLDLLSMGSKQVETGKVMSRKKVRKSRK